MTVASLQTLNDVNLPPGSIADVKRIDVPQILSKSQVQSYVEDGFLVLDGLVKPAELEELKADTLKLARGGYPCEQT